MRWRILLLALPGLLVAILHGAGAAIDPVVLTPVPVVQDGRLMMKTPAGEGVVPIHVSRDWSLPQPGVTRAVIMIHGWQRRDLDAGELVAARAGRGADSAIIIVPQFLIQADVTGHNLPPNTLRWSVEGWKTGYDAEAPAPISSFDVLDAILARLADPGRFPDLKMVVIAGHSAGGQFVQRYAVIGHGQAPLLQRNIRIRYVIANPSSYAYFTAQRPAAPVGVCPDLNRWHYGLDGGLPRYALTPVDPDALRRAYMAKDIITMLGLADTDPNHRELDRSCAGGAQGPTRLTRGLNFLSVLLAIEGQIPNQRLMEVPGVAHNSRRMFASDCGVAALFDVGQCPETPLTSASLVAQPP